MPTIPFQNSIVDHADIKRYSPIEEEELKQRVHYLTLPRECKHLFHIRLVRMAAAPVELLCVRRAPLDSTVFSDPLNKHLAYSSATEERTGDYVVVKDPNTAHQVEVARSLSLALATVKTQHQCPLKILNQEGRKCLTTNKDFFKHHKTLSKESWSFALLDGQRFRWRRRQYSTRAKAFYWELTADDMVVATTYKFSRKDGTIADADNYPVYINAEIAGLRDIVIATLILVELFSRQA